MDRDFSEKRKKHNKASEHREHTGGYTSRRIRAVEAMYEREAFGFNEPVTKIAPVSAPKPKNLRRK
jgi:hypothetical protein